MKNLKDFITESKGKINVSNADEFLRRLSKAKKEIEGALKNTDCVEKLKSTNLFDWYSETFTKDVKYVGDMDKKISLFDVVNAMMNGADFYDYTGVTDSIDRERIFKELTDVMSLDYNYIYDIWLLRKFDI